MSQLSAAVDDGGVSYSLLCTPVNQSDMRLLQPTLAASIVPAPAGTPLHTYGLWQGSFSYRTGLTDRKKLRCQRQQEQAPRRAGLALSA